MPATPARFLHHRVIDGNVLAQRERLAQLGAENRHRRKPAARPGCWPCAADSGAARRAARPRARRTCPRSRKTVRTPRTAAPCARPASRGSGGWRRASIPARCRVETRYSRTRSPASAAECPSTTICPRSAAAKRAAHQLPVAAFLGDDVVGGKHAHHRIRIDRLQDVRGQPDGRRGIALRGLRQNLPRGNLRKLPHDFVAQVIVGQHPHAAPAESPGRRRSTVFWISERAPTTFSTCLAERRRLRGQKRVPRPPARIRP